MYKVSVIVPVYNTEKYLEKCLKSLVNQSLQDIQIICVDNGSTDNSVQLLKDYSRIYSNFQYIIRPGGKQGHARNEGLKIAQGEYIGFVDSDDYIDLDFYEKLYWNAKENDASISMGNLFLLHEKNSIVESCWISHILGELIKQKKNIIENDDDKAILVDVNSNCNKIFKRSFLKEREIVFPENIIYEDNPFNFKTTFFANRIVIRNDVNYYYIQREKKESTTGLAKQNSGVLDIFEIGMIIRNFLQEQSLFEIQSIWKQVYFRYIIVNHYIQIYLSLSKRIQKKFFYQIKKELEPYSLSEIILISDKKYHQLFYLIKKIRFYFFMKLYFIFNPIKIAERIIVKIFPFGTKRNIYLRKFLKKIRILKDK